LLSAAAFEFAVTLGLADEMYFRDSLEMRSNRTFIFYVRDCSEEIEDTLLTVTPNIIRMHFQLKNDKS